VAQDLQEFDPLDVADQSDVGRTNAWFGELRKLGLDVAKSTVEKHCIRRGPCPPAWKTF